MKSITFGAITLIYSINAFAIENGNYVNKAYTANDAPFYSSVQIDKSSCKQGGVVARFYNADPINFCIGHKERNIFTYKKCIGKEINEYPVKICIGIKKDIDQISTKEVTYDKSKNAVILFEREVDDNQIVFEQEYQLIDLSAEKVKLEYEFKSYRDGRSGKSEYLFEK
jgi:hypothetical protein